MPNVIVTCTFNPPSVSIHGASIRQDTIDALQRALPKQTTTSPPTYAPSGSAKLLLTNGTGTGEMPSDSPNHEAGGATQDTQRSVVPQQKFTEVSFRGDGGEHKVWHFDLVQHYCDQNGRAMISLVIIEALEEEGFALCGTHAITTDTGKDVTRLLFARA
ncbi:hypothetical protein JKF63_07591 [Porcisia hertigi]|uniref:Uncharacterized protein n=1 Tax=Porcisia hertigi TaxID=2761500 RepID=A0A836LM57_9TRYP|nr:hypothetical protein JKF63_07591 [Porcisia hertigi]